MLHIKASLLHGSGFKMAIKFGRPIEVRDTPVRDTAAPSLGLTVRMRRNRKSEWARRLVRENVLTTDDLIWPLFVTAGSGVSEPIASMPGVNRLSVDRIGAAAQEAEALGIPCVAIFPYTSAEG